MEEKKRLRAKDIVYLVDFVINIVLVVMSVLSAQSSYLTGEYGSLMEALLKSNIFLLVCMMYSILVVLCEILYGIGRLRGKEPEDMNIVDKWPNIWIAGKVLILIALITFRAFS